MSLIFRRRPRRITKNPSASTSSIPQPFRLSEAVPLLKPSEEDDVPNSPVLGADILESFGSRQPILWSFVMALPIMAVMLLPTGLSATFPPQTSGNWWRDTLSRLAEPSFQDAAWKAESIVIGFATALIVASWRSRRCPENHGIHHAWLREVMWEARRETFIDVMAFILGAISVAIVCVLWISLVLSRQLGRTDITASAAVLSIVAFMVPFLSVTVPVSANSALSNYATRLARLKYLTLWRKGGGCEGLKKEGGKFGEMFDAYSRFPVLIFLAVYIVAGPPMYMMAAFFCVRGFASVIIIIFCFAIISAALHVYGAWLVAENVPEVILHRSGGRSDGRFGLIMSVLAMLALDCMTWIFLGSSPWVPSVAILNFLWLVPVVYHYRGVRPKSLRLLVSIQILGLSYMAACTSRSLRESGCDLVKKLVSYETAPESPGAGSRDLAAVAALVVPANAVIVDAPADDGSGRGKTTKKGRSRKKRPTMWEVNSRIVLAEGGDSKGLPLRQAVLDTAAELMADAGRTPMCGTGRYNGGEHRTERPVMPITDAMRARHVVRQYLNKPLPDDVVATLRSRVGKNNRTHGTDIRLLTGSARVFGPMWGTVRARSVHNCLVMTGPDAPDLDERLGHAGADLMLVAQGLGLNTWWVGGTFSKSAAARASGAPGRVVAVVALGYGASQGSPHTSKRPEEVASYDGGSGGGTPAWFTQGVEAALLAPTAFGKQAFTLVGSGNEVTIRCAESPYAGQDRGIVKYHFEVGAGHDNFTWAT